MNTRAAFWLVWSILALALLLIVLGCMLLLLNDRLPSAWMGYTLAFLAFLIVGILIASRRPENPIGWMFCVIGLASAWDFFAQQYAIYALVAHPDALPGGVWLAWSQIWMASITWALMFFALLLFPTGRLPSPRWRPLAWAAAGAFILLSVLVVIEPGPLPNPSVPGTNPTGIEPAAGIIESALNILIFVSSGILLAIGASVIVRFRRARGAERQQLKWLAYAAGFLGITPVGIGLLNTHVLHNPLIETAVAVVDIVAVAAVPTAIGVAILRYRLYEIDLLINRTLVYGSLTALLALIYFGGIVLLQRVFVVLTGEKSTFAVVVSTLVIAALFNPLRRRIQSFIDRRFYRRKYDARKTLETFSAKLREETDLEALENELVGVVRETMQPAHVSLWLRSDTPDTSPRAERSG
jgi:hypothetical protein